MKTVILVRHADIDAPPAPGPNTQVQLSATGRARAEALVRVAGAAGVTAVFTSTALRTKQTAAPLAAALGLESKPVPDGTGPLVAGLMAAAAGPVVLVVGHSNTVPQMVAALGAPFPGPSIQGFDDLFVVTVLAPGQARAVRLKYGAGTDVPAPPEGEMRVSIEVEGIALDLPSYVPRSALDADIGARTPFAWTYNYLALRLLPRTLWLNGASYGPVRPGDRVRLEAGGKLLVNGIEPAPDPLDPFAASDEPSRAGAPAALPLGPVFTDHAGARSRGLEVEFRGDLFLGKEKARKAVSGADVVGEYLVLVSDEMKAPTVAQLLKRDEKGYTAAGSVRLPVGDDEADLEAVGADRATGTVYVTGAHARTRKIEDGAVGEVKRKKPREQFFRFKLEPDGTTGPVEGPKSLIPALETHPVLKDFAKVASKENGIDIEGLAVRSGRLHFGFRGPVLRDGWVPVLSCTWDDPSGTAQVKYIRLAGRGIRDLTAVADGFLVLAGPVGDGDGTYRVYFWDGSDQLPAGTAGPGPQRLGEFTGLGEGKPEGLVVLEEHGGTYEVLLLCDGLPDGGPTRWKLTRP